jgi:hypothetical protein
MGRCEQVVRVAIMGRTLHTSRPSFIERVALPWYLYNWVYRSVMISCSLGIFSGSRGIDVVEVRRGCSQAPERE